MKAKPNEEKEEKKTKKISWLKLFAKIFLGIIIFLFLLLLFIRSPWGQGIIVDEVVSYLSKKTNTKIAIDRLFITFSGNVNIEGLYLEDKAGDTLLYSRELEANIPFAPLIRGDGFTLRSLDWQGGRAHIKRKDTVQGFNFGFLMDAFAATDTTAAAAKVDTTATPMKIDIGKINIEDLKLTYNDQFLGMDTRVNLGQLKLKVKEFDLPNMTFRIGKASLENTRFLYAQTKIAPETPKEEDVPLPFLAVDELKLKNVGGVYRSIPDGILADLNLSTLLLELPQADLENNAFVVERLEIDDSEVHLRTRTPIQDNQKVDSVATAVASEGFQWPELQVNAENLSIKNTNLRYQVDYSRPTPGKFNPNAVGLQNLDVQIPSLVLENESLNATIEKLQFKEASGMALKEAQLAISVTEDNLKLQNLVLQLNENRLEGDLAIKYTSLNSFLETPENATLALDFPVINVNLKELYQFQPELRKNEYFASLAQKTITGNLAANGKLAAVKIDHANIKWGNNTSLAATGTVFNATNPDALRFDLPRVRVVSTRNDLLTFVKEEDLGIQLPERVNLVGSFSGTPQNITADAVLNSSEGKIAVNGHFKTEPELVFAGSVQVEELQLGHLLKNATFGSLSLNLEGGGEGNNVNELDAVLQGSVTNFEYNNYVFKDLNLYAQLENGEGFATVDYKDYNLDMSLESFVQLDSVAPKIAFTLDVIGADLMALGLSVNPVNTAMEIKGDFKGNAQDFDGTLTVTDGAFVYANQAYLLGDIDLLAHVRPDTTSLSVRNRMLELDLFSNAGPQDFIKALTRHYEQYFNENVVNDTVLNPVNIDFTAKVAPSPILEEVFVTRLEAFDTIDVKVNFREKDRSLAGNIQAPYVKYAGSEIDSLRFDVDSDAQKLNFNFGLKSLDVGPLAIKETLIEGKLENQELHAELVSNYKDEPLMKIKSVVTKEDGVMRFHIDSEELIFNSNNWQIASDNEILLEDDFIRFNNFKISRENQSLTLTNDVPEAQKEHLGIEFSNFNLAALFSYLNPETALAAGELNGNFVIVEPFGSTGLIADLNIQKFEVMEVPLGVLSLDAQAKDFSTYEYEMTIKEGHADVDLTGSYAASEKGGNLDMQLDLNKVDMVLLEGFSMGAIINSSGSITGKVEVKGDPVKPTYKGNLHFDDSKFTLAMLNTPFTFPNEDLRIDNEGLYLDNFDIQDVNGNSFVLDGAILTESFLNPEFDLSFSAKNFIAANSSEEDFDLFYGKAVFDAKGSVTGNLEVPKVELDLDILKDTDITYIIPQANIGIEAREGVVIFVNRENPDNILTRRRDDKTTATFSGFSLNSYLSLQKGATFKVVISEETGDNFKASGEGDVLFDIYPNGRTTMSGRVELTDGHYEMSLYNLVSRKFDIMKGSSIVWAGDPLDADLDITAVYKVETAASGLMASQITGADMNVQDQFRQELDFMVYLKIGGDISAPRISFGLDMPEDEQGALSGQVYGRVQQINQQENELNKQVFSLLVLNRFFPTSGSAGTEGGTLAFARDNLNEALSDQLNIFSDKILGSTGVDLNFGLDSYTDYSGASPQDRTDLQITAQKKLLNDRLVVSVGSQVDVQGERPESESSTLIGNVSLDYLITEDGRFRLQGFRKNTYENVIDGQLIVSGLALIYTQEFNRFKELWHQVFNTKAREEEEVQHKK